MMICIEHKEAAAQPLEKMLSSMVSLNEDEEYDEEEEDEYYDEEDPSLAYSFELKLLDGALAPPPPPSSSFNSYIHPQQQQRQPHPPSPVLTTKDGYIDHSLVAARAVHELSALALDSDGFFWTNHGTLNQLHYQQTFPRPTPTSWTTHASRASAVVSMDHSQLVKRLTTDYKWAKLFPSIVSKATFLRFLVKGSSSRNPDGSLQLIHATLQATTPFLPKRTFAFLRTCKQINHSTWVVADIPIDRLRNVGFPCGCLIQGIADGLSEVIWVDHLQVEENYLDPNLYTDLTCRGFAYGAQRWVACLERSCERRSPRTKTGILLPCLKEEEDQWQVEKKSVMRLSQRMVTHFCSNISFYNNMERQPLSSVPGLQNPLVYTVLRQSPYHDDPKEMVLISATTFTLPHSPDFVFGILGDEHTRHEWDASGKISQFTEPTCYTTGNDPRNKIYVYQTHWWTDNEVVLQEASVNRSGSLLVWSMLKRNEFDRVRGGRGPAGLPLIRLSGLAISSNCHQNTTSSSNTGGGSIVTLGAQHEAHDIKELEPEMRAFVHKCIRATVDRIEAVLNKAAAVS